MLPSIPVQGAYLRSVVVGHTQYDGVPRHGPRLGALHYALGRLWRAMLMRRSQTGFVSWTRMRRLLARCGPEDEVKIAVLKFTREPVAVQAGDRLAQGIPLPITRVAWEETAPPRAASRGGFGSTGG